MIRTGSQEKGTCVAWHNQGGKQRGLRGAQGVKRRGFGPGSATGGEERKKKKGKSFQSSYLDFTFRRLLSATSRP